MSYTYAPYGQPPPQQGGYYQQPPQPYGAPPVQYPPPGQFPPQGQYPPPAQHYQQGQYPPSSQYPPAHQGYGAPPPVQYPPQGYNQAPPIPAHPYNAQPGGYGQSQYPPTPPSLGYGPLTSINWRGDEDATALRKAMKGFGTDEVALIRILTNKDPLQILAINDTFHRTFGRNLAADLKSETSGNFERGLLALSWGPLQHDVHMLHDAVHGLGTKEAVLNDVLLGRSNADMNAIKHAYQQTYGKSLESDIRDDLSLSTKAHFTLVLSAQRVEDSAPVIHEQVNKDARDIYLATEGKVGSDSQVVFAILSSRNDNQIRAIAHEYPKMGTGSSLERVIEKEFYGHMQDALLFQLRRAIDKYMHQAMLLEDAMAGLGTRDELLVNRVVRFHWDRNNMVNVRGAYEQRYRKNLAKRIKDETSGDYRKLLLACIGEPI